MAQDRKLRVIIVGGGLAGLATARILREYHDVTVFERASSDNATGGQGVCFFPATVKILQTMGYDEDRAFPCHDNYFRHYDRAGKPTETIHLNYKSEWGADIWSQLRSDARDELFRLATGPAHEVGIPDACGSVNMVYKTPVVDVDTESALVTLGDGSTFQGDLVISKYILQPEKWPDGGKGTGEPNTYTSNKLRTVFTQDYARTCSAQIPNTRLRRWVSRSSESPFLLKRRRKLWVMISRIGWFLIRRAMAA